MANALHSAQTAADGIHIVQAFEVADASARDALVVTAEDVGKIAKLATDDGGAFYWILQNNVGPVWKSLDNAGSGFIALEEYAEADAPSSTPLSAFVEAFKLTTSNLPAGDYLISWFYEVKNTTTNGITRTRVQLDDSAVEADLAFADVPIPVSSTSEVAVAGYKKVSLGSGVHTVDIDFFPFTGSVGRVLRKRINIRRVA